MVSRTGELIWDETGISYSSLNLGDNCTRSNQDGVSIIYVKTGSNMYRIVILDEKDSSGKRMARIEDARGRIAEGIRRHNARHPEDPPLEETALLYVDGTDQTLYVNQAFNYTILTPALQVGNTSNIQGIYAYNVRKAMGSEETVNAIDAIDSKYEAIAHQQSPS